MDKQKLACCILCAVLLGVLLFFVFKISSCTNESFSNNTLKNWFNGVTVQHDSKAVASLFSDDATLVGTVSQKVRTGDQIEQYFDYFVNLPNISAKPLKSHLTNVTDDVYLNTLFVEWNWDGLEEPVVARMTFLFKKDKIYLLHSSALPDRPDELQR